MLDKNEKLAFFTTSYTPMWIIFLLKLWFVEKNSHTDFLFRTIFNISGYNIQLQLILIVVLLLLIFWSFKRLNSLLTPKNSKSVALKVVKIKNISIDYITNYFSLYLFPFFALDIVNPINMIILGLILFLSAYLYVKNNIVYINPILTLCGYSIYKIDIEKEFYEEKVVESVYLLTSREKNKIPQQINRIYKFSEDIFFESKKDVENNDKLGGYNGR